MKELKEFITKNKATILVVLGAISSFLVGISSISTDAKFGTIVALAIVIIGVITSALKNGFTEETIKLIVNAIALIQDIVGGKNDTEVVSARKSKELSKEEIKELLLTDLK